MVDVTPTGSSAVSPASGDTFLLWTDSSGSNNPKETGYDELSAAIRADIVAGDLPTAIDASNIADGSVSNAEFQYLNGVTSAIQTQLDAKLSDITGEALSTLSDVTITTIASGELLKRNGSAWINNTLAEAGISATGHSHATTDITSGTFADARIAESNVTQHQSALSITESQISNLGSYITGSSPTITTPTLTLKQGTAPTPTAEGDIQRDTDDNKIKIGDGAGTKTFSDDSYNASTYAAASHNHAASEITSGTLTHERGGLEADVSSGDGFVEIKSGSTTVIKTNHAGTTAPTTTDDTNSGYAVGSRWIDTTNDKEYVCLDATASSAVWTETTQAGSTPAMNDISDVTITSVASGEVLKYNGSAWINNTLAEAGISATGHTHTLSDITDSGALAALNTVGTTEIDDDAVTYAKIQNVSATDKLLGRSTAGAGVVEEITCTSAGRALLDDASASAQRTTLGLNSLSSASLTPASSIIQGDGLGGWEMVTPANFITNNNILDTADIGTSVQAYDAELAAIAGLTSAANKVPYFTGSGTAGLLDFKDEDTMSSDSATAVASQQSVKAYVDTEVTNKTESIIIACSDETTDLTTGTAKATFRMPYAFTVTDVRASVTTAPTGATITVDINESGTSILSTKLTIDATEKTSTTAATAAVISDSALADDAEMTIDIDQVGSTVAGAGLKVYIIGHQ